MLATPTTIEAPVKPKPRLELWFRHHFLVITAIVVILLIAEQFVLGPDLLFVTGILTTLFGLRLAAEMTERFEESLQRLVDRQTLPLAPDQFERLEHLIAVKAAKWSSRGGILIAAVMALAIIVIRGVLIPVNISLIQALQDPAFLIPLAVYLLFFLLEVGLGVVVGRYLGRAAAYGRLGTILQQQQLPLNVQPSHLDGAAGVKPLGDFYFSQAMLVAIPAIFLGVWVLLINAIPPFWDIYDQWVIPYLVLLAIVMVVEIFAFVAPMWSFHEIMRLRKVNLLREADTLSGRVAHLQAQIAAGELPDEMQDALKDRLAVMTDYYWSIQRMPTWPMDTKTFRLFSVNIFGLLIPFVGQFISTADLIPRTLHLFGA